MSIISTNRCLPLLLVVIWFYSHCYLSQPSSKDQDLFIHLNLEGIYKSNHFHRIQEYLPGTSEFKTLGLTEQLPLNAIRLKTTFPKYSSAIQVQNEWDRLPDITDKLTVLTLANISHQAYVRPNETKTYVNNSDWLQETFGQEDGVRGVVYIDRIQKVIVMGLKGTSIYLSKISFDPSSHKDRINDNMMFGCCPAGKKKENVPLTTTINCEIGPDTCDYQCFSNASQNFTESYWTYLQNVYNHLLQKYPDFQFWFTGHSLGGSLASLMGVAHRRPAVTFNAVGEVFFAMRLGISIDQSYAAGMEWNGIQVLADSKKANEELPIWHFGTVRDPIFMGNASGLGRFGYTIHTKCHFGKVCYFDPAHLRERESLLPLPRNQTDETNIPLNVPFEGEEEVDLSNRDLKVQAGLGYYEWLLRNLLFHRLANFYDFMSKFEIIPTCHAQENCLDCPSYRYVLP